MGPTEPPKKPLFAKLPPGRNERSPEETAKHQRERLTGAMIEAVWRNGYPATTLREVVALAGVSNTAFYRHFDSIQDCFLAAFDEIVVRVGTKMINAYLGQSEFPRRLRAAFDAYLETIVAEPKETHLMLVDLISLGAEGVKRRQQVAGAFEVLIRESLAEGPAGQQISEVVVRGIVGGLQRVVYRRTLSGETEHLSEEFDALIDWALSYRHPKGIEAARFSTGRSMRVAADPLEPVGLGTEWDAGTGEEREVGQRERIVRAAITVAGERGYESLSIPALTHTARISNETFYEHFNNTEEAFFAAIDTLGLRVIERVERALSEQKGRAEKIGAGLETLLAFLAENPGLARILFIDALAAGTPTLQRVDQMLDTVSAMFELATTPAADGRPLPAVVVEAIGGGPFFVVQREISEGRTTELLRLQADLTYFVLAPYTAPTQQDG
jgi:AcrR family transcriptional regulator